MAFTSRSKQHVAVWNIEQGAVVSFMDRPTNNTFALSSDGLLIAFVRQQHINLHSATTGTMIGACHLEELTNKGLVSSVFIEGDKRIMVETSYKVLNLGPQHLGFIIDTTTLVVEDRYFLPPRVFSHHALADSGRLVCLHHYTLDLIHLKGRIVSTPASLRRTRCDKHCTAQTSTLDSPAYRSVRAVLWYTFQGSEITRIGVVSSIGGHHSLKKQQPILGKADLPRAG